MLRAVKILTCVLAIAVLVGPVLAQDALTAQKSAQNKALALRAARADAMRKLSERINGLNISSTTKVKDFVTENDQIRSAMRAYLLGMREVGSPEFSEDGICTVKMEITLDEVIRALRRLKSRYYKNGKLFKTEDFSKMTVTNNKKIIRVFGSGAQREEEVEDELVPSDEGTVSWASFNIKVKDYWKKYCTGRGRLMAERAARLDAMRRLVERIKGVRIDSTTTVKDFVAEDDQINLLARSFLRGAKEIGVRYHSDELIVEVEMQVKLKQVFAYVNSWAKVKYKGDKMKLRRIEQRTLKTETRIIKETGMGVPPAKYLKKAVTPEIRAVVKLAAKTPGWVTQKLSAIGQGAVDTDNSNKAQAKLMAYRAAELDARRKLAERIEGLAITSNTSVKDFVAESDEINTAMMDFQVGAYVVESSKKMSDDGVAQVTVEIEMKRWWNSVIYYKKKLGLTIR